MYACQYWAVHLSLDGMSDELVQSLHDFPSKRLLLRMEALNLSKQINTGIRLIQKVIGWLKAEERIESTILLARDARRFVIVFATSPVSRSTPHLYVSMLASWPDHQFVSHHYSRQVVGLVQVKGIETAKRQRGLLSLVPAGSEVLCVAYSSNGRFFAAGNIDGRVMIWDATNCQLTIDSSEAHTDWVQAIAISPDGTHICSGSHDFTLCVWNSKNGQ
ncbi:quinon protein alcohol dehydrogenase-like superfamily [Rhizoctonia solani]|nr:quinon protein alcohol dehydrogenase-like superfamily [Rhizoctonia solani]